MTKCDCRRPTFSTKSFVITLIVCATLCLSTDGISGEMSCESDNLKASEIEACVSDQATCEGIGTLKGRVQVRDFLSSRLQPDDDKLALNGVALVCFALAELKSVRFASNGFKNKSLFRLDNDDAELVLPCFTEEVVHLTPGTYILKSSFDKGSINDSNRGELNTLIETVTNVTPIEPKSSQRNGEKSNRYLEFRRTMGWAALLGSIGILIVFLVGYVL